MPGQRFTPEQINGNLKELEAENTRPKKRAADLSLEKTALTEAAGAAGI